MHQWHITLAFGFALGYGARYLHDRIRRSKRSAEVYKGRWPVLLLALLSTASGCVTPPASAAKAQRAKPALEEYKPEGCLR